MARAILEKMASGAKPGPGFEQGADGTGIESTYCRDLYLKMQQECEKYEQVKPLTDAESVAWFEKHRRGREVKAQGPG